MSSQLGTEDRLALGVRPRGPGAGRSLDPDSSVVLASPERAGSSVSCAAGSSSSATSVAVPEASTANALSDVVPRASVSVAACSSSPEFSDPESSGAESSEMQSAGWWSVTAEGTF